MQRRVVHDQLKGIDKKAWCVAARDVLNHSVRVSLFQGAVKLKSTDKYLHNPVSVFVSIVTFDIEFLAASSRKFLQCDFVDLTANLLLHLLNLLFGIERIICGKL